MSNTQVEVVPESPDSPAGKLEAAKQKFRQDLAPFGINADSFIKPSDEALRQPTTETAYTRLNEAQTANDERMKSEIARNANLTEANKITLTKALTDFQAACQAQLDNAHALMINSAEANQLINQFVGEGPGADNTPPEASELIGGTGPHTPAADTSTNLMDKLLKGEIHTIRDPQSGRCIKYNPDTETMSADNPDLLVKASVAAGYTDFNFTEGDPATVIATSKKMMAAGIRPTIDPSLIEKWKAESSEIESKAKNATIWDKVFYIKVRPYIESYHGPQIEAINTASAAMKNNYSSTPPDNTLAANNAKVYGALQQNVDQTTGYIRPDADQKKEMEKAKLAQDVFVESAYGRDKRPRTEITDQDTKDNKLGAHLSNQDSLSVRRAEFTSALESRNIPTDEVKKFYKSNTPLTQRRAMETETKAAAATLEFLQQPNKGSAFINAATNALGTNNKRSNAALRQMANASTADFSAADRKEASKAIFNQLAQHPDQKFAAKKIAEIISPLIYNRGVSPAERNDMINDLRAEAARNPNLQQRMARNDLINRVDGSSTTKTLARWVDAGTQAFRRLGNDDAKIDYLVNNVHNTALAKNIGKVAAPAVVGGTLAKHVEQFQVFSTQDSKAAEKYLQERVAPLLSSSKPADQKAILQAMASKMRVDMGDNPNSLKNGDKALEFLEKELKKHPFKNKDAVAEVQKFRNEVQNETVPQQEAPQRPIR